MTLQPQQPQRPQLDPSRPAGWYPHGAGLRWWDGAQWTAHTAPPPPVVQPPRWTPQYAYPHQPQVVAVGGLTYGGHLMHIILSVCTLGLWLPIYGLVVLLGRRRTVRR